MAEKTLFLLSWFLNCLPPCFLSGNISDWNGRNAPPESARWSIGSRRYLDSSKARITLVTVMGYAVPPFTVASEEPITQETPFRGR